MELKADAGRESLTSRAKPRLRDLEEVEGSEPQAAEENQQ